ncbi:MAG: hypothetical protein JJE36_02845 [Coriobacteriia bacterium]|nr:hypothetical protein [Coriobacteriia bacterium]
MITISSIDTPNPRQRARRVYFVEMSDYSVASSLVLSALEIGVADTFSSLEDFEIEIDKAAFKCAKQRSFRLLSMRDYTTFEIASKLKR